MGDEEEINGEMEEGADEGSESDGVGDALCAKVNADWVDEGIGEQIREGED